jgi:hypothetical protein
MDLVGINGISPTRWLYFCFLVIPIRISFNLSSQLQSYEGSNNLQHLNTPFIRSADITHNPFQDRPAYG